MDYVIVQASSKITVYHTTNLNSANNMLKSGIGLNIEDYTRYFDKLIAVFEKKYNKPISKERVYDYVFKDAPVETEGDVSFFQSYESCVRIKRFGDIGGETRSLLIDRFLKKISRELKISFNEIKNYSDNITLKSKPVIVVCEIPKSLIQNKNAIGKNLEVYTKGKVDKKYIEYILDIVPSKNEAMKKPLWKKT